MPRLYLDMFLGTLITLAFGWAGLLFLLAIIPYYLSNKNR
jgi:hypothetical protein